MYVRRSCSVQSGIGADKSRRSEAGSGFGEDARCNRQRRMTRRSFVAVAAFATSMLLWKPRIALADEPWWDGSLIFRAYGKYYGSQFWGDIGVLESGNGGVQAGTLYTDRWVSAKTPWVEWDISSNQYIRTAAKITMRCDFTTELYYHVTGLLEIACGSYNGKNASYNLWHTDSGDDTRFSLYHAIDDKPEGGRLEESKVVVIDNEAGSGIHKDGAQIWTDYRQYPQSAYSIWIRRSSRVAKHSFQLRSWFWNYYYFGTNWYFDRADDPPIGYSTRWVEQQSDRIYIQSETIWGNRVVVLESAAYEGACLESAAIAAAGEPCLVSANAQTTRQHWVLLENDSVETAGTYKFVPVVSTDGAYQLDQHGGGPTMSASAAHLWYASKGQSNPAQAFWIHGSSAQQWIFADCSGMALDCGGTTGFARFHSNGYPGEEWGNEDHIWHIQDAWFCTVDYLPFSLEGALDSSPVPTGESVAVPDPNIAFRPGGSLSQTRGIQHNFTWIVSDDDFVDAGFPEVVGSAYLLGSGWLEDQPAVNLVGATQRNDKMGGLALRIEGGSLEGAISVQLFSDGAWRDGSTAGSAASAVSLRLEGGIAQRYEVLYRACSPQTGWGAWTSEGAQAVGPSSTISGVQVRMEPKGIVLQGKASSIVLDEAWNGKFLTCVVRAETDYCNVPYRGAALSRAVQIGTPTTLVSFIADDDPSPCFEERVEQGALYRTPPAAVEAGRKEGCSGFDGWYVDEKCETPFEEGSCVEGGKLVLRGRSVATIRYALTDRTSRLLEERECFADESMAQRAAPDQLIPPNEIVRYGTRLKFKRQQSVWYEDRGRLREMVNAPGVFTDAGGSSAPTEMLKVTSDATLYLAWSPPQYEGIVVS